MLNLNEIYKPKTLDEALALLQRPDTTLLAGGTELIARRAEARAVIDLTGLGLDYIREVDGAVAIGATTRLQEIMESPLLRSRAGGVIAQAAGRASAAALRNQATIGGTLFAAPAGILSTALLALDARLSTAPASEAPLGLSELFASPNLQGIVTEILIPSESLDRRAALEFVARTPRDMPIVSVCASLSMDGGVIRAAEIALAGVAASAVRAKGAGAALSGKGATEPAIEGAARVAADGLTPPSDYRGSAEYRLAMAQVLTRRALRRALDIEVW